MQRPSRGSADQYHHDRDPHGADYLGTAARLGLADPAEVLDVLAARMIAPGDAWIDQEPARVAHAALDAALTTWESSTPEGRPPSWLGSVYATVSALYLRSLANLGRKLPAAPLRSQRWSSADWSCSPTG